MRIFLGLVVAVFCSIATPGYGQTENHTVVLYPDLGSTYNDAFEAIATGIAENKESQVHRISLPESYSAHILQRQLDELHITRLVALGRRGLRARLDVGWTGTTLIGGVIWESSLNAGRFSGISLDPDPHALIEVLPRLLPRVKRVHVVMGADQRAWLVPMAKAASAAIDVELVITEITSNREVAPTFRSLLQTLDPSTEALWLALEPRNETTLKLILSTAWARRLAVFSSAADHAHRGTLYSAIPDYLALGRRLGGMLASPQGSTRPSISPNVDVKLALNVRTARHLGLDLSPADEAAFEIIYR